MNYRKQKLAFYRKLYLALLIDQGQHNVPSLERSTGMPRRTIQDCMNALADVGIDIEFHKTGKRNNDGIYQLLSWGPIDPSWVQQEFKHIAEALKIKYQSTAVANPRSPASLQISQPVTAVELHCA
ncbi:winged helix-turn-helix domain-containing protein [Maricurvus nonylphenolicus]|uniref:winged helix-turn-helix domain-containing protein n=1 Tax=Maricurvus nonylphenolicus TaxID=1008307 RepID=UPI0036F23888